jgi:hypothetical protein
MIRFSCSKCGNSLSAPDGFQGRASSCRNCKQAVVVPGGVAGASKPPSQPGIAPQQSAAPTPLKPAEVGQQNNQPRGGLVRTYLDVAKWFALGSAMLLSLVAAGLPLAGLGELLTYAVAGLAIVVGFGAIGLVIAARRSMLESAFIAIFLSVAGLLFTINIAVTASKSKAAADEMAKATAKEKEVRPESDKSATGQKATAEVLPKVTESPDKAQADAALMKAEKAEARAAEQTQKATQLLEQIHAEQVKLDKKRDQITAEAADLAAERAKIEDAKAKLDEQDRDLEAAKKAAADLLKAAKPMLPAPDKRIAELEAENNLLKKELEKLRTKSQVVGEPTLLPITKADFRQKVMTFKNLGPGYGPASWSGLNGQGGRKGYIVEPVANLPPNIKQPEVGQHRWGIRAEFKKKDFDDAFGNPHSTQTTGEVTIWSWRCRDGTVEVILVHVSPASTRLSFIGIDDH